MTFNLQIQNEDKIESELAGENLGETNRRWLYCEENYLVLRMSFLYSEKIKLRK